MVLLSNLLHGEAFATFIAQPVALTELPGDNQSRSFAITSEGLVWAGASPHGLLQKAFYDNASFL